jgi:hypothetical protein
VTRPAHLSRRVIAPVTRRRLTRTKIAELTARIDASDNAWRPNPGQQRGTVRPIDPAMIDRILTPSAAPAEPAWMIEKLPLPLGLLVLVIGVFAFMGVA